MRSIVLGSMALTMVFAGIAHRRGREVRVVAEGKDEVVRYLLSLGVASDPRDRHLVEGRRGRAGVAGRVMRRALGIPQMVCCTRSGAALCRPFPRRYAACPNANM